jgi:hypothetical protein
MMYTGRPITGRPVRTQFRSTGGTDLFTINPRGGDVSQLRTTASYELYPEWATASRGS